MNSSLIGRESTPRTISVEKGQLLFFAKATGSRDPVYRDEDAARAAGHPALPAPPTFLVSLDLLSPTSDPSVLRELGVDIGKLLHAEQRFTYRQMIYAGDEITLRSRIADMFEKKGGALQFIVTEFSATNQRGELVGTMTTSIAIRS